MQVGSRPSDNIRVFSRAEKPNLELINIYIYFKATWESWFHEWKTQKYKSPLGRPVFI